MTWPRSGPRIDRVTEPAPPPKKRRWNVLLLRAVVGLTVFLLLESFLPPAWQPSARAARLVVRAYQAVGSPLLRAVGARCKYQPSCSQYALDAFTACGTLRGFAKTCGRLARCSPWGAGGPDPAVPRTEDGSR